MEAKPQPALNDRRVLIVEDEFFIALDIETTLRDAGADVVGPCSTLAAAMVVAEKESLSAAVLDVRLGRDSTEPIADLLAQRHIPYLFYTGQGLSPAMLAKAPNTTVLLKPVPPAELVGSIVRLLDKHPP